MHDEQRREASGGSKQRGRQLKQLVGTDIEHLEMNEHVEDGRRQ